MRYLGHSATNGTNSSLINPVIKDFNVKVHTLFAYFNDVAGGNRNTLFKQYCTCFMDLIYIHCLIEKLKICILHGE